MRHGKKTMYKHTCIHTYIYITHTKTHTEIVCVCVCLFSAEQSDGTIVSSKQQGTIEWQNSHTGKDPFKNFRMKLGACICCLKKEKKIIPNMKKKGIFYPQIVTITF